MKIAIIGSSSWPIPVSSVKARTGDYFYALLAQSLDEMGHEVSFFAPEGSYIPPHGHLYPMYCTYGKYEPSPSSCEQMCFNTYADILRNQDVVHDFSVTKIVMINLFNEGHKNVTSTLMGGCWLHQHIQHNIICNSNSQRLRALRGATDYENTPTPDWGGISPGPVAEVHVVNCGIDTDFYTPIYNKQDYILWLGRWHPVRGYKLAIELARETGIELVMAGEHPDRETEEHQKAWCLEAREIAKDLPNVHFEYLPDDPVHHTAKRELIRNAKALLFPVQFNEPFGLMQVESLACGTPVIGTNYGSVPEIIDHRVTGYIVNNEVKEFAQALDLIKNIHPAICREQAVKRFDRKVMAQNYIKQYQMIINGKNW